MALGLASEYVCLSLVTPHLSTYGVFFFTPPDATSHLYAFSGAKLRVTSLAASLKFELKSVGSTR